MISSTEEFFSNLRLYQSDGAVVSVGGNGMSEQYKGLVSSVSDDSFVITTKLGKEAAISFKAFTVLLVEYRDEREMGYLLGESPFDMLWRIELVSSDGKPAVVFVTALKKK